MSCENASALVPSYLDGELTEEQTAPLRSHLFDCPACREVAKEGKTLQRWFAPGAALARELQAPAGFASRVARRAFAGDPGLLDPVAAGAAGAALPMDQRASSESARTHLPLLLKTTAAAAAVLFVFALAIQNQSLPSADGLEAQYQPPWEKEAYDLPARLPVLPPAGALGTGRSAEADLEDAERTDGESRAEATSADGR